MTRKLNRGVTLIEVMAALVIALVIAIGVMSYQYAGAQHARKTDARVTASRLGLLFLENWVAMGGIDDDAIYDPAVRLDLGLFPLDHYHDLGTDGLSVVPGLGTPFKSYSIFTNGTWFWVKLSYDEEPLSPGAVYPIRELGVSVAWMLDFGSEILGDDPALEFDPGSPYDLQRLIRFSKSVIYVPPST